ncbi:STAS domain-containing protein [Streptomyces sp. NBC_01498]|uniref:STAS domain-containing protein n=1 Tax=Streptomyces sp. NBC_01498 TaxID=2975870 RepID=UPI002E7BF5D0|nr:STAS domain-containing protein [Streptomyces sp. NBC_01498]WTL24984.1 STAS domain-containing protein [Streptomyces sp. NBC_01498]
MEAIKTILVGLRGPVTAADVPQLCDQLAARLRDSGATDAVCDVAALGRPTAVTVDALARLHLVARRHGCRMRLRGACPELLLLLNLTGLTEVLRPEGTTRDGGSDAGRGPPGHPDRRNGRAGPTRRPTPAAPGGRTAGTNAPCPGTS